MRIPEVGIGIAMTNSEWKGETKGRKIQIFYFEYYFLNKERQTLNSDKRTVFKCNEMVPMNRLLYRNQYFGIECGSSRRKDRR